MCPRCAYDLEGMIATWTQSCPLRATCSECGLDFDCTRALSPRLIGPRWSYEHGFQREVRRWWATSLLSLLPRRMFHALSADHRIHRSRLVRLIVIWIVITHFGAAAACVTLEELAGWRPARLGGWYVLIEPEFWRYHAKTFAFPYVQDLVIPVGPMSSMHVPCGPTFLLFFGPTFLMPAWLLLLGQSLRRAKVRNLHLVRGLALATPCAALYCALSTMAIAAPGIVTFYAGVRVPDQLTGVAILICAGHHVYWWYVFIRRYLRLRHAALVVFAFLVLNVLALMLMFTSLALMGANL